MTVREQFDDFMRFCKRNKVSIGIVVLMTFLTYGFMLFNFSFSIDTEDIVVRQLDFYDGWIGINRYGLVFTKWLFGVLNIVPGYASILMVLSTIGYGIIWMYFFYWIGGPNQDNLKCNWIFSVLFLSSVPVLELVNFQCLSFEVAFAMLLCAVALIFEWRWIIKGGGKCELFLAIIMGVWCFASYQAFVPLYISASLIAFLIQYQNNREEIEKKVISISLKLFVIFVIDYILYNVLGRLMMYVWDIGAGTYTENMIQWGKMPVRSICIILKDYFLDVFFARNIFWNWGYLFVCLGLLLIGLRKIRDKIKKQRFYLYYLLVLCVFLFSPFLLPVLMGAAPVVRGQLALPFVVAIGTQIIFEKISGRLSNNMIIQMAVVGLLLLFTIRKNLMKDNRLLYSEYVVRQQEYALTEKIIGNIEETGADGNCAVVILGQWSPQYNPSMIQGETLGRSFYEWDAEVPGGIEKRVLGYWRTLGYQYKTPGDEVRTKTIEERADMPAWPAEGSVVRDGNLVIIKLPN